MDRRRLLSPTGTTLEPLEKHVYQRLKRLRPQLENQTLLVAVSGGIDSVVLLHVLVALQERLQIKLQVLHVNHGVRGRDADNDSKFVAALCKKLRVRYTGKKLRDISSTAGENLLRRMRYEILFAVKEKIESDVHRRRSSPG
jgi:tRNA(Ile)-lysidine synthase